MLDISTHMMFKVIQAFLASTTISLHAKKEQLNQFIDERIRAFIYELKGRLPPDQSQYYLLIRQMPGDLTTDPQKFMTEQWSNVKKNSLPKDLHYLYDHIDMLKTYYTLDSGHTPSGPSP